MGRPPKQPLNLWGDETTSLISTPLNDHELEDAFAAGMIFLQNYPLEEVGGVERVLQLAYDFAARREAEQQATSTYTMAGAAGFGARIRNSMWRTPAPKTIPEAHEDTDDDSEESEEEDDDDEEGSDEDEGVPKKPTLGKRKAPSKPQKPPRKGPEKKARRQYPHFRKCTCC